MSKTKAEHNRTYKQRLKESGGKRLTIALNSTDVKKLEEFMEMHRISTYKDFINFCLEYKLVGFNNVSELAPGQKSDLDVVVYKGKRYEINSHPTYGTMNIDEKGNIFPFPA